MSLLCNQLVSNACVHLVVSDGDRVISNGTHEIGKLDLFSLSFFTPLSDFVKAKWSINSMYIKLVCWIWMVWGASLFREIVTTDVS